MQDSVACTFLRQRRIVRPVGAACIVFIDLAPVALGDATQMLGSPVAMSVERRKAANTH